MRPPIASKISLCRPNNNNENRQDKAKNKQANGMIKSLFDFNAIVVAGFVFGH